MRLPAIYLSSVHYHILFPHKRATTHLKFGQISALGIRDAIFKEILSHNIANLLQVSFRICQLVQIVNSDRILNLNSNDVASMMVMILRLFLWIDFELLWDRKAVSILNLPFMIQKRKRHLDLFFQILATALFVLSLHPFFSIQRDNNILSLDMGKEPEGCGQGHIAYLPVALEALYHVFPVRGKHVQNTSVVGS